jgi:hypothetical protein
VDEASILQIRPKPFSLPDQALRQARWQTFLPEYLASGARRVSGLPERRERAPGE